MRRIAQVSVTNLFGIFDHTIPFHLDERITIIHGPNGFGKTVILRLLNEIFSQSDLQYFGQDSEALRKIPFREFRINFDDGSSFWMVKSFRSIEILSLTKSINKEERLIPQITFYDSSHSTEEQAFTLNLKPLYAPIQLAMTTQGIAPSSIDEAIPGLEYVARSGIWRYLPTEEVLSLEEIVERFGQRLPITLPHIPEPLWLVEMRSSISFRFVEAQRLVTTKNMDISRDSGEQVASEAVVTLYSKDLVGRIKTKLVDYAALSQSLDRSFPARVVNPTIRQPDLSDEELRRKLADLERKRTHLIAAGLLDEGNTSPLQEGDRIDSSAKVALSIYIEDTERKLAVFDELASRIEQLTSIINKRFLYKKLFINKEQGFVFTTEHATKLSPTDLSFGEQHELVLFYSGLFIATPGSLVLIDEPELSLHVAWQLEFLQDLQEVAQLANLDVLIATHSPQIINDRWDLTVQLEGPRR